MVLNYGFTIKNPPPAPLPQVEVATLAADKPPSTFPKPTLSLPAIFIKDQDTDSFYTIYQVVNRFFTQYGNLQIPTAAPLGIRPEIAKVDAGTSIREITWVVERVKKKPILPHWDTQDPSEWIQEREITTVSPLLWDSQTPIWHVEGRYLYLYGTTLGDKDPLPAGSPYVDTTPAEMYWITPDLFDKRVLKSPTVQGGLAQTPPDGSTSSRSGGTFGPVPNLNQ